jgi:predicted hydrolase (HD superfamily)
MAQLTMQRAKEILQKHFTEPHLYAHSLAVSAAMGAMAEYFGEDRAHWEAVGYLHDVDFEKYPGEEHCLHVRELLAGEDVDEADVRAIISHGYGLCTTEVEPTTNLEKSLFTVDELTGIIVTTALMRPTGIEDLELKSLKKKYKDKKFAAKCNRDVIDQGAQNLRVDLDIVMERCIEGMKRYAKELGIGAKE